MSDFPLLFLMGPTAIGKTATAIAIAKAINAEIINVDSGQVYRAMSIGTAKPTPLEQAEVPHHLVDIVEPEDPYSAARFCEDAVAAIHDIRQRGRTPLLAGGTMLYFNALEKGLAPLPAANAEMRAELENEAKVCGWPAMHDQLKAVDPTAAARIHPNDPQRTQRALEVYRLTGKSLTDWQADTKSFLPEPALKFALMPTERNWLHERIQRRYHLMLDNGFLDEVRELRDRPNLTGELPSMRSVGYRQAWQHLDGVCNFEDFVEQSIAASRQLAKRQMTWVRGMDGVLPITCDDDQTPQMHTAHVIAQLENNQVLDVKKS